MNLQTRLTSSVLHRGRRWLHGCFSALLLLGMAFGPLGPTSTPALAQPVQSPDLSVNIVVKDAQTGDPIPYFKWLINLDNSHDEAALENPNTFSPVVATGDESNATGILLPDTVAPDRGYLVSVLANDGVGSVNDPDYKIGGKHFKMPEDAGDVIVELESNPLPLATIKVRVFHDNALVNGEWDIIATGGTATAEEGLEGFHVVLEDVLGEVVTDWFGNPICTEYEDLNNNSLFDLGDYGLDGPIPVPFTGGYCVSGPDGIATIPNMGPDKYDVHVIPPDGSDWTLTATIEGTQGNDAWIQEGAQGFATEPEAGLFTQVWFGFVRPCTFGDTTDDCGLSNDTKGTGTIKGRLHTNALDVTESIFKLGNPIPDGYVALNNIGGNDEQVWMGRADPDGFITINDVPAGLYLMTIWDLPIDHIIKFKKITIEEGETVLIGSEPGTLGKAVPPWFGKMRGSVYIDANENGIREPGEPGLPAFDLDTRFKDGAIQYTTFSDRNGNYEFPEVFELEHFAIAEVGYGRFKQTGVAAYNTDEFGNPIDYPWANDCTDIDGNPVSPCTPGSAVRECTDVNDWRTCEHGPINQDFGLAALLQAEIVPAAQYLYFDWGKKAFGPGENGGIVGIAFNATTRNELNARLQANEDYEPGIPGVTVNLYAPVLDGSGHPMYDSGTGEVLKDHLANTYVTDSFHDLHPTDCIPVGSFGRDPTQILPYPRIWDKCLELPSLLTQAKPGVFDGGYAFDLDCSNLAMPGNMDPANLLDPETAGCPAIPAGKWVVQVVPPTGFRSVMEEDINVFSGDVFVPQIPPPPCAGPKHTVDVVDNPADADFDFNNPTTTQGVYNPDLLATEVVLSPTGFGSPYEGKKMPLCNERLVTLKKGFNANSDFFIFTEVPAPGRIIGILLDDLALDLDPTSPGYADKRAIPNTPIGLRDYTGKLITTVYSDDTGRFEVLVPSTGSYNCPLPAGPCPGMWFVVGNDPGDFPDPDPKFNPNYQTLPLVFQVWPGLTTYADVAIIPNTNFVAPGPHPPIAEFNTPPVCNIPATTPDVRSVSQPYGSSGDHIFVNGTGFGATQGTGQVTLDGTPLIVHSWSDTQIETEIVALSLVSAGPHQLLVTNDSGATSPSGITFHVLGGTYTPPLVHVDVNDLTPGGDGSLANPYNSLQDALDAAPADSLILVHPGTYYDRFIMHSNIKLQGYGTAGLGATILDGRFLLGASGLDQLGWEAKVAGIPYAGAPLVPWGQVLTVIAADGQFLPGLNHPRIDGFKIEYGRNERGNGANPNQGGGIYAHGFARYLEISNNLIQGNFGSRGGGITLGLPTDYHGILDAENDWIRIHHNQVLNNGGKVHAGALAIFNGAENYEVDHNLICGNYAAEYGGGISHFGLSPGGRIHDNQILFNYAFDEGGGVMIAGELRGEIGQPGTGLSLGSGPVTLERNLIQGNVSNDDGGGVRLLNPVQWKVRIVNNIIVNNLATDVGGGISLDDALDVEIVNNTVAQNISTATAEDADTTSCSPPVNGSCPHAAGLSSEGHSTSVLDAIAAGTFNCAVVNCSDGFSNPVLFNNILWHNVAFAVDGTTGLLGGGLISDTIDLEVVNVPGHFDAQYSDCTHFSDDCRAIPAKHNITSDPKFLEEVATNFEVLAFADDPSFVYVLLLSSPSDSQGDYHLNFGLGTPAEDAGTASLGSVLAPCDDFDGDGRPNGAAHDIGADEKTGVPSCAPPPPPPILLYFSTAGNTTVPGVAGPYDDADIYAWHGGTTYSRIFDGSAAGLPGNADIDALVVVGSNTFYMSFEGNVSVPAPVGTVQDEDIVKYDAGTWSLFFDGTLTAVGLAAASEDVDAFEILPDGHILVSTEGNPDVPGVTGEMDEDLLHCVPNIPAGPVTACTWSMYFDGSMVGLAANPEDVDGAAVAGGNIYLSTQAAFSVAGPLSGTGEDVFVCNSPTGAPITACGSFTMYFDGSANGITDDLDAIDLP